MQIKNSMEKNNKYMVGFDLGDRDAQISFCSVQDISVKICWKL